MKKASIILCLLNLCIAGISFFFLPEQIPMHYNGAGMIDRYGSRFEILIFPIISLIASASFILCKKMDPKKENYEKFTTTFYIIVCVVNTILLATLLMVIYSSFYPNSFHVNSYLILLLSISFIILGNVMPKIKSNYFMGVRTPWTLANEQVWYKTHRFSGKVFFFGGILSLSSLCFPRNLQLFVFIAFTLLLALLPVAYSYIIFKKEKEIQKD